MSIAGSHRAAQTEPPREPTLGKLVADATRDVSTLVQSEIALAKSELKVSVTAGGMGAALLGAAAFLGLLVIIFFSVTVAYLIHWNGSGLDLHWAFLIVTVFYLVVAGVLAAVGIKKVKQVRAPRRTIATAKEIPSALKGQH
uniref:Phage holin family protein n=1 Tax=uncultured Nocardioidaceae bacterium TaxID=253824 RepID=A0A6J4LDK5_9ACTN|nr:MAG: protein of unknown function DUF1469 [uncultured Nocardioidaceae bacterium]